MTKEQLNNILNKLEDAKDYADRAVDSANEAEIQASEAHTQAIEAHDAMTDVILMLEEYENEN